MTDPEAYKMYDYSKPRRFYSTMLNRIDTLLDNVPVELNCLALLKLGLEEKFSTLRQLNLQIFEHTE